MKPFRVQFLCLKCDNAEALELWKALGLLDWTHDVVVRQDELGESVERQLSISKEAMSAGKYMTLVNWPHRPQVSHVGMRCTPEEGEEYRRFFAARGIDIKLEYETIAHAAIPGRRFHDTYYDTAPILGVDIEISVELK